MAIVSQDEMDRRIAAAGGSRLVHAGTVGKRKVPNPSYDKYDPSSQETIELDIQQWKSPDGHTIQAVQMPDGTWDVTQDEPPAPKPAAAASSTVRNINGVPHQVIGTDAQGQPIWGPVQTTAGPAAASAGTKEWRTEGTPDGQGGFDNSRPIMAAYVNGQRTGETRQPTGDELKAWYTAAELTRNQGKTDAQIEAERKAGEPKPRQTRPNPADPTRVQEFDPAANGGAGGWVDAGTNAAGVQAAEDRKRAEAERNRPDTKVETVTKNGVTYTRQISVPKDGGQPVIRTFGPDGKELPGGIPGDAQIQNAPPFNPDWNKPALGLIEYASAVRARTDLTDEQKAKLIQEAHVLATATTSQANSVLGTQQTEAGRRTSERGQDVSMANTRLNSASSDFGTSVRAAADATKYSLGPEAASVLPYFLAMARATGQMYGGFNTPAPVNPGAAVTQMHGQTIPGLGSMLPATVGAPPAGATDAAPPMAPTPPNALGVGAIGNQPAPGGPPAAAPEQASPLPPPIFAPQSVAPPPAPPVDPASIGAPEPPQAMQQQGGGSLASLLGNAGPWAAQPQQAAPSGLGALMMQRAGGYNPVGVNQILMDAGIDPDVIATFGGVA